MADTDAFLRAHSLLAESLHACAPCPCGETATSLAVLTWSRDIEPDAAKWAAALATLHALHGEDLSISRCVAGAAPFAAIADATLEDLAHLADIARYLMLPDALLTKLEDAADVFMQRIQGAKEIEEAAAGAPPTKETGEEGAEEAKAPIYLPRRVWPPPHFACIDDMCATAVCFRVSVSPDVAAIRGGVPFDPDNAAHWIAAGATAAEIGVALDRHLLVGRGGGNDARKDAERTLVETAALAGDLPVLETLRARGMCAGAVVTALGCAAVAGHLHVVHTIHAWGWTWTVTALPKSWPAAIVARRGRMDILQFLAAHGYAIESDACAAAASAGRLSTLQWLRSVDTPWTVHTTMLAARGGHLPTLQWALDNGCAAGSPVFTAAAEGGHIPTLEFLHGRGVPWSNTTSRVAAVRGDLPLLCWLLERGCPHTPTQLTEAAATAGSLPVLEYLHGAHMYEPSARAAMRAAARSQLPALQWLVAHGCPLTTDVFSEAAAAYMAGRWEGRHGRQQQQRQQQHRALSLAVVDWLHEHRCPWHVNISYTAVRQGDVEMLEWALARGYPIADRSCGGVDPCASAARAGHLPVLQWLVGHGFDLTAATCASAALACNLEILQWARAAGAPWDVRTIAHAAIYGYDASKQTAMLEWLHTAGAPWDASVCTSALSCGCTRAATWLVARGCPVEWDAVVKLLAEDETTALWEWARDHGCPADRLPPRPPRTPPASVDSNTSDIEEIDWALGPALGL